MRRVPRHSGSNTGHLLVVDVTTARRPLGASTRSRCDFAQHLDEAAVTPGSRRWRRSLPSRSRWPRTRAARRCSGSRTSAVRAAVNSDDALTGSAPHRVALQVLVVADQAGDLPCGRRRRWSPARGRLLIGVAARDRRGASEAPEWPRRCRSAPPGWPAEFFGRPARQRRGPQRCASGSGEDRRGYAGACARDSPRAPSATPRRRSAARSPESPARPRRSAGPLLRGRPAGDPAGIPKLSRWTTRVRGAALVLAFVRTRWRCAGVPRP